MPAVLVDLDGTVCDASHRSCMIKGKNPDWVAYSLACNNDRPVDGVIELVRALDRAGWEIIVLSGRSEQAYGRTVQWLVDHKVPFNRLWLRPEGEERPNPEFKASCVAALRQKGVDVRLAIDDYPKVAEMFVALGIQCVLVARDGKAPQFRGPAK